MSMSNKKCCVPGCIDSGGSHKTLHIFPHPDRDRERFNTWIYSIGGNILGLTNQDIYNNRRVCRAHFEENFCCRYNRISNTAVPTLHLPGPLALPRFTFDESRPAKYIQDCSTPEPGQSTSTSEQNPSTKRSPLKAIENLSNIVPSLSKRPLALPRFTIDESRPAKYIQDCSTPEPGQSTLTSEQNPSTERSPLKAIENLSNIVPSLF